MLSEFPAIARLHKDAGLSLFADGIVQPMDEVCFAILDSAPAEAIATLIVLFKHPHEAHTVMRSAHPQPRWASGRAKRAIGAEYNALHAFFLPRPRYTSPAWRCCDFSALKPSG